MCRRRRARPGDREAPVEVVGQRAGPAADSVGDVTRPSKERVDADRDGPIASTTTIPTTTRSGVRRIRVNPTRSVANETRTTKSPPPSAPARLQPTVTRSRNPIARAPVTPARAAAASDGARSNVLTWFVTHRTARLRPGADRSPPQRVRLGPCNERDEEPHEKQATEERAPRSVRRAARARTGDDPEHDDHCGRVVDRDGAEGEPGRERNGRLRASRRGRRARSRR